MSSAVAAAPVLSALLGPVVGRAIDARGGRDVLAASNLLLAAGLVLVALAPGPAAIEPASVAWRRRRRARRWPAPRRR